MPTPPGPSPARHKNRATVAPSTAEKGNARRAVQRVQVETVSGPPSEDMETRIRRRAYELYEAHGPGQGSALEDWLQAEREMLSRQPPA